MKSKILKIIKITLIVILTILVIILIKKIVNKEEIPLISGRNAYVVLSGSMEPEINIGDIVFSKNVEQKDIVVGDIVTYSKDNMLVTHRVVEIKEENGKIYYITKGDNNNTIDIGGGVTYANILGKLNFKIPRLGYVVLAIQRNLYVVIAVFVFFAIYVLTKPAKMPKESKKENKETDAKKEEKNK